MSQVTAAARAGARPGPRPAPRPAAGSGLRVVSGRAQVSRGHTAFAVLCVTLLAAGLGGLLMLNIALGRGAYTVHTLQGTTGELEDSKDQLTQALAGQQSAQALAARAAAMGMVPARSAAFLRLSDGAVVGVANKSEPTQRFTVVTAPQPPPPKTPEQLAAAKVAAAAKSAAAKAAAAKAAAAKAAAAKAVEAKAAAAKAAAAKAARATSGPGTKPGSSTTEGVVTKQPTVKKAATGAGTTKPRIP